MISPNFFIWEDSFPPVYGHTSISFLKQCPGYSEAKLGNMRTALLVAYQCINPRTTVEIKEKYPDAVLLPVITNNKLPEALAKIIGMKTYTGVRERETFNRKSLSAMERLLYKPMFDGKIVKDKNYIIVDDIITQGGTVSSLRKHVINNGAHVAAVVSLAYATDSQILVPDKMDIAYLINKYNLAQLTNTLRHYKIADDLWELTRAQVRYLLRFKDLNGLINKIEKTLVAFNDNHLPLNF